MYPSAVVGSFGFWLCLVLKKGIALNRLEFIRFFFVGAFCFFLNVVFLYLLTDILGLHYLLSCTILFFTVNFFGFYLNEKITFRSGVQIVGGYFRYNIVSLFSFLMIVLQMYVLVSVIGVWYLYANMLVSVGMVFVNYFLHRWFTFLH